MSQCKFQVMLLCLNASRLFCRFLRFHDVFASSIAPVLVRADSTILALREILLKGKSLPVAVVHELSEHYSTLCSSCMEVLRMLDEIDRSGSWQQELEVEDSMLAQSTSRLQRGILPRIETFVLTIQSYVQHECLDEGQRLHTDTIGPPFHLMPLPGPSNHDPQISVPMLPNPILFPIQGQGVPFQANFSGPFTQGYGGPVHPLSYLSRQMHVVDWERSHVAFHHTTELGVRVPEPEAKSVAINTVQPSLADSAENMELLPGMQCKAIFYADRRSYFAKVSPCRLPEAPCFCMLRN